MQLGATVSLDDAIALGVTAAPIGADKPMSDAELVELGRPYAKAGITPVQTNGYCNLAAPDEAIRRENVAATRELLRRADLAGSRAVVVDGSQGDGVGAGDDRQGEAPPLALEPGDWGRLGGGAVA